MTAMVVDALVHTDSFGISVTPVFSVDGERMVGRGGWSLRAGRRGLALADRLVRAIRAGVAVVDPEVRVDVRGVRYATGRQVVLGRRMSADLKRLGF